MDRNIRMGLILRFIVILLVLFFHIKKINGIDYFQILKSPYNMEIYSRLSMDIENIKIKRHEVYNIKVGIIDTGFNKSHPKLNLEWINNPSENDSLDRYHGTAVSGIIASKESPVNEFNGIIPGLRLYVYEIPNNNMDVRSLTEAINEMIKYDVDILNISLSTNVFDRELYLAVKKAIENGIVIVASSGNYQSEVYNYPASFDIEGIVSVGNINPANNVFVHSTFNDKVDVWAPGVEIYSLGREESSIEKYTGTSFSAAMVTSLVVLIKAKCKSLTPKEIDILLKEGAYKYTGKWGLQDKYIYLINFFETLSLCTQKK